ncbi:hypothetical protein FHG87_017338 [Trinorchestia longiramus]|nr:hypothetical protein FHG87_017338 [Trinorchestia longiramus]
MLQARSPSSVLQLIVEARRGVPMNKVEKKCEKIAMFVQVVLSCLFVMFTDTWALQEPPIYYDNRNILTDKVSQQDLACWQAGGMCTPLANCPMGYIYNLPALGDLCGDSGLSVCCTSPNPTLVQVEACNKKQAFCTMNSLCPLEFRLPDPQLCGGQEEVSCCSTGHDRKRSFGRLGFLTAPRSDYISRQKSFVKLRPSDIIKVSPDQLDVDDAGRSARKFTINAVSIAKKNAELQQESDNENSNSVENSSDRPVNLASFGAVEKSKAHSVSEENCFQKGGLCVQRELCPLDDQLGPHNLCGFQNFVACCKASALQRPTPSTESVLIA